ncbi:cutinase family protein [Rhodococcus tibetensis]|uniref:Cutinase family protein n=1 Tax=Rhodococcus tibetensis TaxID=2965064 RepID=A0ABT1QHT3_9NOCA|nr:cutinase family protein [Rhodococcus sp. FXJ9.536]MCQ4121796.1 cutinase family protein [Rhodococcus sp. FXJ9.536]
MKHGVTTPAARRRRMASGLLAPGVLGLAALLAAPWSNPGAPTTTATALTAAAGPACYDMVSIAVAGRNDAPRAGTHQMLVAPDGTPLPAALSSEYSSDWVDPVVNAPGQAVGEGSYAAVYIDYPANMASYEDAVNVGVDNTETVMRTIAASCPDTKFAIVGYSEGADVARRVAMEVGNQEVGEDGYDIVDPASVVGVVILADAGREFGEGPFPGAENEFRNPDGFDLAYQSGGNSAPGRGSLPGTAGGFGALDGKVASFCSEGDLTCSAPENIGLLQLAVNVGRQLNVDALEREGLTVATAQDMATVLGRIALAAFADIQSQENWMQSDETFLDVLIKVSDPAYKLGTEVAQADTTTDPLSPNQAIDLVYLPTKVRNEIIGFIADNENTVEVVMSDPYQQTLGPGTGHHFDYWRDADPAGGKPLTSSQYAAAWLTHLAQQAEKGQPATITKADTSAAALVASSTDPTDTSETTSTTSSTSKDLLSATDSSAIPTTTPSLVPTAATQVPTAAVVPPASSEPSPSAAVAAAETPSTQQEVPKTVEVTEPEMTTIPTTTTVPPSPVQ